MRRTIDTYKRIMVGKILTCKTTLEVLSIIDEKVELIKKGTIDKSIIYEFIDSSLFGLRHFDEHKIAPGQFPLIRTAIDHLKNLKLKYKAF